MGGVPAWFGAGLPREPASRPRTVAIWTWAVASAFALLLLGRFVARHAGSLYDDAYIYFRFADHVVRGCGLRYNCGGEAVEGFSSPLYLLLLAGGRLLTTDLPAVALAIGAASMAAALLLALAIPLGFGERSPRPLLPALAIAAGALVLSCDDYLLLNAVSGLETALGCAAAAGLLFALRAERRFPLAAAALLALLVRPEFALFLPALLLCPWARDARFLLRLGLALAALTTLRLALFEDVLPNTYWAKAGGTPAHLRLGLSYLGGVFADFPAIALAPLALSAARGRRAVLAFLAGSAAWMLLFLRTGGDHFFYGRLAAPLVPALTMLGLAGAATVLGRALGARGRAGRWAAAAALLVPALGYAREVRVSRSLAEQHGFPSVQGYAAVGRYLARTFPGATFAAVPVGAMAHVSGLDVIDLVGLTTRPVALSGQGLPPGMLRRNWLGHERHNTPWVLEQAPDLIVLTGWRSRPFREVGEVRAKFYAEWLLLRAIKEGRAPYRLHSAPVGAGQHWPIFVRAEPAGAAPVAAPAEGGPEGGASAGAGSNAEP